MERDLILDARIALHEAVPEARLYDASVTRAGDDGLLFAYESEQQDYVAALGPLRERFTGVDTGRLRLCPFTHENRLALNALVPETKPRALGRSGISMGLGDRLGMFGAAQLEALRGTGIKPVLAQQSMREMGLAGRCFDDVIDNAAFAVFRAGWREGFAADGDHLKSYEDIRAAVAAGCTMITLDCSDVLLTPTALNNDDLNAAARYSSDPGLRTLGIPAEQPDILDVFRRYCGAVDFAAQIYRELIVPAGRAIDFELSLDETAEETTYLAHYYVGRELTRRGVTLNSLAPRFVGEFHKGVDYIGEKEAFLADLQLHAKIAAHLGHKLSIHSGSDKFSIFPAIRVLREARFHIKTSGTSYLAAIAALARLEPGLYRRVHASALAHFQEASAYYVVHAQLKRVPDISLLPDERLPELFKLTDARQLIHITYGFLIGPDAPLKTELFAAFRRHKQATEAAVCENIRLHAAAVMNKQRAFSPRLCVTIAEKIMGAAPFLMEGDFAARVREARRYGFDAVEIHVANPDDLPFTELKAALAETGLAVSALGTGRAYVNDGLSLIDDDPVRRGAAITRLLRFIDAAKRLHAIVIIGCLRGNIIDFSKYDLYLARLSESVRQADTYATSAGVTLVIEPINRYENNYLSTAGEVVSFIQNGGFTNTKLMLDTFHMNIEEVSPIDAIERYAPYLSYFHAADSNRLYPGGGHLDFDGIFACLSRVGYTGDISAECLPGPSKEEAALRFIANVKERINRL